MTRDARFEDGGERPLRLAARDAEDLQIVSALLQDAVLPASEIRWQPRARRISLLVNRLRREDAASRKAAGAVERVRSVVEIEDVLGVSSHGFGRQDRELVLSILSLGFEPGETPPEGHLVLTLAGDGAIRARVEAIEVTLSDVTRPYLSPSGRLPDHGD